MNGFARLVAGVAMLAVATAAQAAPVALRFIGEQTFASGTQVMGTTLGGLSGIDYDAATGRYLTISDDRSQINPARFYSLTLDLTATAFNAVTFTGVGTLRQPDGSAFPALGIDPEAIRLNGSGGFFYTSEGDANAGQLPFVREAGANGSFIRDLAVPGRYNPGPGVGIRQNLAFESLTIAPDGTIFTATENALFTDGPAATLGNGSLARILSFDPLTGAAGAEYVYAVDPIVLPPAMAGGFATNGLVELLALGNSEFIAIERSFAVGAATTGNTGNTVRLFHVDISNATDVSGLDSLSGAVFTAATKTLLLDLADLGIAIDNIEGITFGQTLDNGGRSLILVSDNNFSAAQFTQFLAFEISAVPEPSSWAMLIAGFGLAGAAVRRSRRQPAST